MEEPQESHNRITGNGPPKLTKEKAEALVRAFQEMSFSPSEMKALCENGIGVMVDTVKDETDPKYDPPQHLTCIYRKWIGGEQKFEQSMDIHVILSGDRSVMSELGKRVAIQAHKEVYELPEKEWRGPMIAVIHTADAFIGRTFRDGEPRPTVKPSEDPTRTEAFQSTVATIDGKILTVLLPYHRDASTGLRIIDSDYESKMQAAQSLNCPPEIGMFFKAFTREAKALIDSIKK